MYYEEHETPWDYYRFTRYAWEHFAAEVGFEVVEIERMEGFYGTLSYSLWMAGKHLPPEFTERKALMKELAHEFAELDMRDRRIDIGMSKNYQVVYRKP